MREYVGACLSRRFTFISTGNRVTITSPDATIYGVALSYSSGPGWTANSLSQTSGECLFLHLPPCLMHSLLSRLHAQLPCQTAPQIREIVPW